MYKIKNNFIFKRSGAMTQQKRELLDKKRRLEFQLNLINKQIQDITDRENRDALEARQTYERKLKSLL